jgi:hypothetical protein
MAGFRLAPGIPPWRQPSPRPSDQDREDGSFGAAGKAHGREIFADIPNFTSAQPAAQISEILL